MKYTPNLFKDNPYYFWSSLSYFFALAIFVFFLGLFTLSSNLVVLVFLAIGLVTAIVSIKRDKRFGKIGSILLFFSVFFFPLILSLLNSIDVDFLENTNTVIWGFFLPILYFLAGLTVLSFKKAHETHRRLPSKNSKLVLILKYELFISFALNIFGLFYTLTGTGFFYELFSIPLFPVAIRVAFITNLVVLVALTLGLILSIYTLVKYKTGIRSLLLHILFILASLSWGIMLFASALSS